MRKTTKGDIVKFRRWIERINLLYEGCIAYSHVQSYVGVTRTAVAKREKKGRLRVHVYILEQPLGEAAKTYSYVSLEDCNIWIEERRGVA